MLRSFLLYYKGECSAFSGRGGQLSPATGPLLQFFPGQRSCPGFGDTDDDNIKDGIEDANQNGRIDGDNNDGKWSESETWTELNPNAIDTDGDTFSDYNEKEWGYNPLSKDTDGDGLTDDEEDEDGDGYKDSTETSALKSDTDGDGLSDKMEIDGWTVIIILEATLKIEEERDVVSDPLLSDYDGDGLNDCYELKNGTDPNNNDTDGDGFLDKYEIEYDVGSSPTGIDGQPPTIIDFDADYELVSEASGPFWDLKIVEEYQAQILLSANDIFGIDWINVHLEGVGDKKIYCGESTQVTNKEFDFTLDARQAARSLLDSFAVNITAEDQNGNIGFNDHKMRNIFKLISDMFIGYLNKIPCNLQIYENALYNNFKNRFNAPFLSIGGLSGAIMQKIALRGGFINQVRFYFNCLYMVLYTYATTAPIRCQTDSLLLMKCMIAEFGLNGLFLGKRFLHRYPYWCQQSTSGCGLFSWLQISEWYGLGKTPAQIAYDGGKELMTILYGDEDENGFGDVVTSEKLAKKYGIFEGINDLSVRWQGGTDLKHASFPEYEYLRYGRFTKIVKEQIVDEDPLLISVNVLEIIEDDIEDTDESHALTIIGWVNPGEGQEIYVIIRKTQYFRRLSIKPIGDVLKDMIGGYVCLFRDPNEVS